MPIGKVPLGLDKKKKDLLHGKVISTKTVETLLGKTTCGQRRQGCHLPGAPGTLTQVPKQGGYKGRNPPRGAGRWKGARFPGQKGGNKARVPGVGWTWLPHAQTWLSLHSPPPHMWPSHVIQA